MKKLPYFLLLLFLASIELQAQEREGRFKIIGTLEVSSHPVLSTLSHDLHPTKLSDGFGFGVNTYVSTGLELYVLKNKKLGITAQFDYGLHTSTLPANNAPIKVNSNGLNNEYEYGNVAINLNSLSNKMEFGILYHIQNTFRIFSRFGYMIQTPISISNDYSDDLNENILGSGYSISFGTTQGLQIMLNKKISLNASYSFYRGTIELFPYNDDFSTTFSTLNMHFLNTALRFHIF